MEENKYNNENIDSSADGKESTAPEEIINSEETKESLQENKEQESTNASSDGSNDSKQEESASRESQESDNTSNGDQANSWHSEAKDDAHAFNWSYEQMHEPIRFDNEIKKDKKKSAKKFTIIIGIVFALAMVILAAAIWGDIQLATEDDIQGQSNVNIQVSDGSTSSSSQSDAVDPDELEEFKNSTVVVSADSSTGTGIIFSKNGYIVTNYHVIEDATSIQISLYNGSTYKATVVGYISSNDIAVLKINADNLSPATFAKNKNCYVTQRVYAVGTPAGASFAWSVSSGIISATNREAKFYDENNMLERKMTVIQTDAPVNPGNSGGPLINSSCEVVGIITMRLANNYVGMGFAIPSDQAVELITKILAGNGDSMESNPANTPTPQMGIVGLDAVAGIYYTTDNTGGVYRVTKEFAEKYPDSCFTSHTDGIYILRLTPGLDAETKLKVGDVIIDIEGSGAKNMEHLKKALEGKKVGDKISLTISRDGEILDIEIELK